MHLQSIQDEILSKLTVDDVSVKKLSLVCSESTLLTRLQADVKKKRLRKSYVIPRSLKRLSLYETLDTVKISTDGKTVSEVAALCVGVYNGAVTINDFDIALVLPSFSLEQQAAELYR